MDLSKDLTINDDGARYTSLVAVIAVSYAVGLSRGLMDAQAGEVTGWSAVFNTTVPLVGAIGTTAIADHNEQMAIKKGYYRVDKTRSLTARFAVPALLGTVMGGGVTALAATAGYLQGRFVNHQEILDSISSLF